MDDTPEGPATTVTSGDVADAVHGELVGPGDVPIRGVSHDSGDVAPGWLFCAVVGAFHDGGEFAGEAVHSGAVAVLTQRLLDLDVPQILVSDVRASMADAARAIHRDPARHMSIVGVTGTNGKTTVVSMLGRILSDAGVPTATMGTLSGARPPPSPPICREDWRTWPMRGSPMS
ncbi:MAG: Mur ligase family protein [Microthrixaceae bacterium]|nr:Mur ligase family protein [Microthrixaceae bacterium]